MSSENTNACRHYLGLYPDDRPACSQGWDVRKWARLGNGGSDSGIGLRLPCTKQSGKKPLFDCPSLCRKTNEEVSAQRQRLSDSMARLASGISKVSEIREEMVQNQESYALKDCPWCGGKSSLEVKCAIGVNNHIHCKCSECGEGFME